MVSKKNKKSRERRYSNDDVFRCISKVDCQRHIHTAARVYTYIVNNYIALIVRANEPYALHVAPSYDTSMSSPHREEPNAGLFENWRVL